MRNKVIRGLFLSFAGAVSVTVLLLAAPSDTPVADAVRAGDNATLRSLLTQGADVNAAQGDGMTALHWAAYKADVETAEILLYAGANVRAATRINAMTPLILAAQTGSARMIEALLESGADPNLAIATGTTPLMLAAAAGSADAVSALIEAGAEVDATENAQGQTALMFAASFNRDAAIKVLMENDADATQASKVVDVAARSSRGRGRGGQTAARGRGAGTGGNQQAAAVPGGGRGRNAQAAASQGRGGNAQAAAAGRRGRGRGGQAAATPGQDRGQNPAAAAGGRGRRGQRGQAGAQARGRGGNAQAAATRTGGRGRGANVQSAETASDAPLLSASGLPVTSGNVGSVRRQTGRRGRGFNRGDRPRRVDYLGGLTPLLFAVREGHFEATRSLLDQGADINAVTPGDKSSPLLVATINGHFDLAKYLLDEGADPKLASMAGATPLYAAVNVKWAPEAGYPQPDTTQEETTYLELMQAFLDKGADVDAQLEKELWFTSYTFDLSRVDAGGATAFWRAAQVSDIDALRLLVAAGADPEIANKDDVKPIHVGTGGGVHGNDEVLAPGGWLLAVRYLVEELGADVNSKDKNGYTPIHNAASIGESELVQYLVDKGGNVRAVSNNGETTADMANGPRQRIQPFPETLALLRSLGSKFNSNCVSC